MGVATKRKGWGIPTKPAGGLLSDFGKGDPCLRLTGRAVPDRPLRVSSPPWTPFVNPPGRAPGVAISPLTAGSNTRLQREREGLSGPVGGAQAVPEHHYGARPAQPEPHPFGLYFTGGYKPGAPGGNWGFSRHRQQNTGILGAPHTLTGFSRHRLY